MNNTKIRLRELQKQVEVANSLNAVLRTENLEMQAYIERSYEKLSNNLSNNEYQSSFKDELISNDLEILKQQVTRAHIRKFFILFLFNIYITLFIPNC